MENKGLEYMVEKEFDKVVVIPDTHHPYHDKRSINAVLSFLKDQKPDYVVLIGDHCDMYSVSRFDKNPDRTSKLQLELDVTHEFLKEVRKNAGKQSKMIYLEGNHEARLKKWLWRNPELHGLRSLELPYLLGLDSLGIEYVQKWLWKDTFLFTHGKRTTMYAPRWELDDNGVSGMSGHTHRLNSHAKTDYSGTKVWNSIGHLCDPKQAEYTDNPNWQQAIGVVHLSTKNKRFFAECVPITEHKFVYGGKVYKG
jgi:predicted phosphodiesterase